MLLDLPGVGAVVVVSDGREPVAADAPELSEVVEAGVVAGIGPGFVLYMAVMVEAPVLVVSQYIHVIGSEAPKDEYRRSVLQTDCERTQ